MSPLKRAFNILFLVSVTLLLGVFLGVNYNRVVSGSSFSHSSAEDKLQYTLDILQSRYVDTLSRDSLIEKLIPKLLLELDPHSEYIPSRNMDAVSEQLSGEFEGIGVMFNMFTDTAVISNVIAGGPSSKAGVIAGDKIITINDTLVAGIKFDTDSLVGRLRGKRGTEVRLGVQRGKTSKLIPITIERDKIPVHSIDASFMVTDSVGYLNVNKFSATTHTEFKKAIDELKKQGMSSVVIDLRENGGGYLDQAIYMANEFLEQGQGIVYTQGAKLPRSVQNADGRGEYKDLEVAILMGPQSASASEVFAGALQDNDRATVVGLRSFGKGLIQEQFGYNDNAAVRITIAHYYTPLGRSIQKPYTLGKKADYQMEIIQRLSSAELLNADSMKIDSTDRYVTAKGKVLYGGGGIAPDVFVPMDTTSVSPYFASLVGGNYIFRYATKYTEDHRGELNRVKTFKDFESIVTDNYLLSGFLRWSKANGAKSPTSKELKDSREIILSQLRGYIGRNTDLSENAASYYFYPLDKTMQRGVEVLR